MDKKHIIIADDEAPLAKAMSSKLENCGFLTTVVSNGEELTPLLDKKNFDLLILDLMMPKVDGFKVLKMMKDKKINKPVFVTSNLGQQEDIDKTMELGAVKYFVKSNTPIKEIVEGVENILSK